MTWVQIARIHIKAGYSNVSIHDPINPTERWEIEPGYSPYTSSMVTIKRPWDKHMKSQTPYFLPCSASCFMHLSFLTAYFHHSIISLISPISLVHHVVTLIYGEKNKHHSEIQILGFRLSSLGSMFLSMSRVFIMAGSIYLALLKLLFGIWSINWMVLVKVE